MNKIFKVIKNKNALESKKVVSELASANVASSDERASLDSADKLADSLQQFIKQSLCVMISSSLILQSSYADIIADTNAPTNQQATILNTASGATQVNIQTPTNAGISVNQYSEFNTAENGTILNNSRVNVQTQSAGWVEGNPWLAGGEAKAIVNQVNSNDPSMLTGTIEVAGKRADVIIANPSGISVDGASILNASGTTLTTGKVNIGGGAIQSYSIENGKITIEGGGLNDSGSDYTRILSRASEINANIHANNLKIVAGANEISADTSTITKKTVSTPAPSVAIDTKALGGMYAGSITLVGTESGVGVNNAGVVNANNFTLSADGKLTNSGTIAVNKKSNIAVKTLENSHAITSNEDIAITADTLNNSGKISALRELKSTTDALTNSGTMQAARLDLTSDTLTNSTGTIAQAGSNSLEINAHKLTNTNGALLGSHEEEPLVAGESDTTTTDSGATVTTDTVDASSGATSSTSDPLGAGSITVASELRNDGGEISGASVALGVSDTLSNTGDSLINVANLEHTGSLLGNQNSKIIASGISALSLVSFTNLGSTIEGGNLQFNTTSSFDNTGGSILGDQVDIRADSIVNQSGHIQSESTLALTGGSLDNTEGTLHSLQNILFNLTGDITNANGSISAATTLDVKAHDISNDVGVMQADQFVNIEAASLHNIGDILSGGDMSVRLENESANEGVLSAAGNLFIEATAEFANSAIMSATGSFGFAGNMLSNNANGEISAENIDIQADTLTNRGTINSDALTWLETGTLNNIGTGAIYGDAIIIDANTLLNTDEMVDGITKSAVIAARELLNIGAQNITNSEGAELLSLGALNIGGLIDEWGNVEEYAQVLDNLSARIESDGDMNIAADIINNKSTTQIEKETDIISSEKLIFKYEIAMYFENGLLSFYTNLHNNYYLANVDDTAEAKLSIANGYLNEGEAYIYQARKMFRDMVLPNGYDINNVAIVSQNNSYATVIIPYDKDQFASDVAGELDAMYEAFGIDVHTVRYEYEGGTIIDPITTYSYKYVTSVRWIAGEKQREYTKSSSEEYLANADQIKESTISSGGNLIMKGVDVHNRLSTISVVGDIYFDLSGELENQSESLYRYNSLTGKFWHCYSDCGDAFHNPDYRWDELPMTETSTEKIAELPSNILAGGAITGNINTINNGIIDEGAEVFINNIEQDAYTTYQGTSDDIEIREASPNLALPTSSLFSINVDDPNALTPYITTDPRFTNYAQWLSSGYMLDALGIDPTNIMKRLGDGYYELRLIKDQIAQLTGKRFLDGYGSDQEQYKALMDAGVTYASAYGLRPGVALSSEQIAQLTSDMVWLVEEQVTLADGSSVTALVPKVYMAAKSGDLDGSGALIAANTINVTVEGALNNSGKMYASNNIIVDAESIVNNQGSLIAEGVVDFVALNDISNLSGSISGGRGVSLVSTTGSVINQTIMRGVDLEHESGIEHYSVVGKTATISSDGGNIVIDAAKNIENIGANISATAVENQDTVHIASTDADTPARTTGGNIFLNAGEEIVIDTAKDKRDYDYTFANGYMNGESVVHHGSSITADGSISMQSGGDTLIRGSSIEAGENIGIDAGGNLNVLAAIDSQYDEYWLHFKATVSKKTVEDTHLEQSVQKSSIKGNTVALSGDSGVTLQATDIKADDLSIYSSEGDITLATAHATNADYHEVRKSSFGSIWKKQAIENLQNDSVAKSIIDASNVTFTSPEGVVIMQGSEVQAEVVEIMTNALMLVSDKESSLHTSYDDSQGVMTRKIIDQGKIEESAVPATINAKEIMLNGESLLKEKLSNENILQVISSENKLTHEQLIQVEAILNSQEWYDESTSMTALGQIIVVAIVTVITMGAGSGVAAGGTAGATSTISAGGAITGSLGIATEGIVGTAVAASIDAAIINAATQILSGAITGELDFDLESVLKSAVMAGALSAATDIIDVQMDYATQNSDGSIALRNLEYGEKISREILHGLAKKAIYGGDIKAIMAESAGNVAFEYIGHDLPKQLGLDKDSMQTKALITTTHSLVGGVLSELGGGDFSQGAIATATSHVVGEYIVEERKKDLISGNVDINSQEELNRYLEQTQKEVKAITSVLSAAVVLATHENVTDEELAITQSMSESVVENNSLTVLVLLILALSAYANAPNLGEEPKEGLPLSFLNLPLDAIVFTVDMVQELENQGLSQDMIVLALAKKFKVPKSVAKELYDGAESAKNITNSTKLKRQLASEEQLSELNLGKFEEIIAGNGASNPIKDIDRLINQYGGNAGDWAKVSSTRKEISNGLYQETHAYVNIKTGTVVEPKTKILEGKLK